MIKSRSLRDEVLHEFEKVTKKIFFETCGGETLGCTALCSRVVLVFERMQQILSCTQCSSDDAAALCNGSRRTR